jgi:F-type H+-transporting ATPase subunit b
MLSNFLSVLAMTEVQKGAFMGLVTIDWTLVFQIANTLVLFLLLRHFLFKPVKGMIEQRQNMITDQLDDAKVKNEDAEKLIADYDDKIKNIEEKGRVMIREASTKAEARASEIIKDAEKDAELIKKRAEKEIEREKLKAVNELKEEIVSLSLLAASKVLEKDIDENQHKTLINQFLDEVGETTWQN